MSLADIRRVEGRMDALETKVAGDVTGLHSKLDEVILLLGKPSNGPAHPADGIYHLLENLDHRVKPFESFYLQMKGALKIGVPLVLFFGTVLWFVAGGKITAFFHG